MADTLTSTLRLTEPTIGGDGNNVWPALLNSDLSYIDEAINQILSIDIGGLATYTLTADGTASDQARYLGYEFTGALTAACTVTLPANTKWGYASNQTTGGFGVILTTGGGTTLTVGTDGSYYHFFCDGANVEQLSEATGNLRVNGALTGVAQNNSIKASVTGNLLTLEDTNGSATNATLLMQKAGTGGSFLSFQYPANTTIGSITVAAGNTSVAYNTTSDRRMKRLHGDSDGALIGRLQVHDASFRVAPGARYPMLVADEVQQHAPWAVTGDAGAVDGGGHIIPQMLDATKLIAALIAYVQKLEMRISSLERKDA